MRNERKHKIEESQFCEYAKAQLLAGVPYQKLAEDLAGKGFEVSKTALIRYHKDVMGGKTEPRPSAPQHALPESEGEPIPFNPKADGLADLEEAYRRQIAIFAHKQKQYMEGKERFPTNELRALESLQKLIEAIHTARNSDARKVAKGKPVRDVWENFG
jgi:hypothetical protein